MRSLIQLYALAVCFCSLMCFVVALGIGIYDVVRIAAPAFTVSDHASLHSNEQYLLYHADKRDLPEAEVTHLREKYAQDAVAYERHAAAQGLVMAAIIVLIDAAVFAIHWLLATRVERRLLQSVP